MGDVPDPYGVYQVPLDEARRSEPTRAVDSDQSRKGGKPRRDAAQPTFLGSLGWPILGTIIPGLGLLRTRLRLWAVLMLLPVLFLTGAAIAAVIDPTLLQPLIYNPTFLSLAFNPTLLRGVAAAVAAIGLIWALSIVVTHVSLRPSPPRLWQRCIGATLVGALVLVVATPTAVTARALYDTSAAIAGVTATSGATTEEEEEDYGNALNPWANKPRLNVLILGGDDGQKRDENLGARTDTVMLASIDTSTGETTLFSLPRQTERMPFPSGSELAAIWPYGFSNGVSNNPEYFLNAEYHTIPVLAPDAIPDGVQDPGAWALKQSVGAALGLKVDYYAMVNMDGFIDFINALDGITVNISVPVPVGGVTSTNTPPDRWLSPGPDQHLNGSDALWYARGRYGTSDYERMSRQRCVIRAVAAQADPYTVLMNYEALTKAGTNIVKTDVPNARLAALLALAFKVKDQKMRSLSFENGKDGFSTVRPNWERVREQVQAALRPPTPQPAAPTPSSSASPSTTPTGSTSPSVSPTPQVEVDECAYNPPDPNTAE
ncbi:MAG: LCP family protein [Propioniciclava sp.]